TLGKTDVLAPNLNTNYKPSDSWKRILSLPPDAEVTILQTMETDRNVVHKIALPAEAEGWVSTAHLLGATPEQVAAWEKAKSGTPGKAVAGAGKTAPKSSRSSKQMPQRPSVASATPKPESPRAMGRDEPAVAPVKPEPGTGTGTETVATTKTRTPPDVRSTPDRDPQPTKTRTAEVTQPEPNRPAEIADMPPAPPKPRRTPMLTLEALDAEERLEALEIAFEMVRTEPIHTAEVIPLRDLYRALLEDSDVPKVVHVAGARAEQLAIWADLQARRMELRRIRSQLGTTSEEAEALRRAFETSGPYAVVGRLVASTIYDGKSLPRLFRVQDEITGRTLAYLRPSEDFDLEGMLDQTTGIVGAMHYEGTLRVRIIDPRRIDLLGSTASAEE
ncbi:MAG: hypothetical protein GY733_00135, partial [bacterium]|nr:hypothetical protein [bacterium]